MVRFDGTRRTCWDQLTYGLGHDWPFPNDYCQALAYRPSNGRVAVNPYWFDGIHEWTGSGFSTLLPYGGAKRMCEDSLGRLWAVGEEGPPVRDAWGVLETTTDDHGTYKIAGLGLGERYVVAAAARHHEASVLEAVRVTSAARVGHADLTLGAVIPENMITRANELNLRLATPEDQAKLDFIVLLTVQTMNYLHSGRHRVAL